MTEASAKVSFRDVFRRPLGGLAFGLLLLEFVSSVQTFVVSTVLPDVSADLRGGSLYGVAVSVSTLALFVSLPFTSHLSSRFGNAAVLNVSAATYICGVALTVLAPSMLVFVSGRFVQGLASGALAAFGLSTAVKAFPEALRPRLFSLMSSMWLVPALVGPLAAAFVTSLVGWRWSLAGLIPLVLAGRFFVIGKLTSIHRPETTSKRLAVTPTVFLVFGLAVMLFGSSGTGSWRVWIGLLGLAGALVGAWMALPRGMIRARSGRPAALGAFFLLTFCFFGGDGLITLFVRNGINAGIQASAVALGGGTVAWVVGGFLQPRLLELWSNRFARVAVASAAFVCFGLLLLLAALVVHPNVRLAVFMGISAWVCAGFGMGLGYSTLSLSAMTTGSEDSASDAATSVVLAESLGGALGLAIGGSAVSLSVAHAGDYRSGLILAFTIFVLAGLMLFLYARRVQTRSRSTGLDEVSCLR